ncbi:MAG: hypothetical protein PWQ67_1211 [Clostridia bacterium]|nr:hypothetical protein [Clostridia bacterium]MDN5322757.1 hypothetical protein [Clostridia bacterium]
MGCPHTCVFCNQKKIAGCYEKPTANFIKQKVFSCLQTFKNVKEAYIEVAFYGGSFTGIEEEIQDELLEVASNLKKANIIHGIRISTRPDYINKRVIERLKKFGVDTIELGVQSLHRDVLNRSQRGHSEHDVIEAVKQLKKINKKVGIQLMPGLPGDTREKVLATTEKVISLKPDFIRIYPTVVIKETLLAEWLAKGNFVPWTLEKAIEITSEMVILFSQTGIPVIRLGLQAAENLQPGRDLVAGPYHPAFGELVKSRIYRKQIEYLLTNTDTNVVDNHLVVFCYYKDISQVKGQKQANLKYFREKFKLVLEVLPKKDLNSGSIAWLTGTGNSLNVFTRREFLEKYRIK